MNYVDLVLIIILALGAFKGYRRGFIYTLGGLFGWIVSLVIAMMYSSNLKIFFDEKLMLSNKLGEWLGEHLPLPDFAQSAGSSVSEVQQSINNMPLPGFMKESLTEQVIILNATGDGSASLAQVVGYGLADIIVKGIAFLILFFIVSFIIKLLIMLFSRGVNATVFGGVNRLGGLIMGTVINACIMAVVVGVLYPLLTVGMPANPVGQEIETSFLTPILLNIFAVISSHVFGFI